MWNRRCLVAASLTMMLGFCFCETASLPGHRPPLGLDMLIQTGKTTGKSEQYRITKHGKTVCAAIDGDGDGRLDRWHYSSLDAIPLDLIINRDDHTNEFCVENTCMLSADYDENGVAEIEVLTSEGLVLFEMMDDDQDGVFESWRCNKKDGSRWIEVRDKNRDGVADYWFHRYGKSGGLQAEDFDYDGLVDSSQFVEYRVFY